MDILFIFLWRYWVFSALCRLSLAVDSEGCSSLSVWGSHRVASPVVEHMPPRCMGFSSSCSWALECKLSSGGTWAWLLSGMWHPPRARIKLVSLALQGKFLSTGPPGRPEAFLNRVFQVVPSTAVDYRDETNWFAVSVFPKALETERLQNNWASISSTGKRRQYSLIDITDTRFGGNICKSTSGTMESGT